MTHQSLSLCIFYSVASGFVRVVATMVLAYPEFLEKQRALHRQQQQPNPTINDNIQNDYCHDYHCDNEEYNPPLPQEDDDDGNDDDDDDNDDTINHFALTEECLIPSKHVYLAVHLCLLLLCAMLSILACTHGPVSTAVPVQTASGLLWNVVAMGIVLRMRSFDKAQRTGTYVVFFSVLSLVNVGPRIQPHQQAAQLLQTLPAVFCVMVVTALLWWAARKTWQMMWYKLPAPEDSNAQHDDRHQQHHHWRETFILLVGMTMSNVGMATSSKTLATLHGVAWFVALMYYIMTAGLGVLFSVVSSTLCDQGIFTPLAAVALIVVNMVLGVIIWQDYKVMTSTWIAYLCCACLMCCGVYLLAEIDLVDQYWRHFVARRVRQPVQPTTTTAATTGLTLLSPSSHGTTTASTTARPVDYRLLSASSSSSSSFLSSPLSASTSRQGTTIPLPDCLDTEAWKATFTHG